MNYIKTKHQVLELFLETRLNYIDKYHGIRDYVLTIDQIVKKKNLSYDVVKIILASLSANEEIKSHDLNQEYQYAGYSITNKGIFAYEDEKYLRIRTERSRARWSFIFSIFSLIGSIAAIIISLQ